MGTQRLAAVAAVHTARHYNHTQTTHNQTEPTNLSVNVFFVSATLCGVLVAVCATCWRRSASHDKPDDIAECRGVYTVSSDVRLNPVHLEVHGPPPAYETVVDMGPSPDLKDDNPLEVVRSEACEMCEQQHTDNGLPSYEAAVMLKDTRL